MKGLLVHDGLVRLSDVQHEVGNGLAPVRIHAELLLQVSEVLLALDLIAMRPLHESAMKRIQQILDGIDTTLARVRALAPIEEGKEP